MNIQRITTARAMEELREGKKKVFQLLEADLTITLAALLTCEFAVEEEEDPVADCNVSASADPPPSRRKKLDRGKIKALADAGWSRKAIAEEMGTTEKTISQVLYLIRKEEESGEK